MSELKFNSGNSDIRLQLECTTSCFTAVFVGLCRDSGERAQGHCESEGVMPLPIPSTNCAHVIGYLL